jgi:hypothetical protein
MAIVNLGNQTRDASVATAEATRRTAVAEAEAIVIGVTARL